MFHFISLLVAGDSLSLPGRRASFLSRKHGRGSYLVFVYCRRPSVLFLCLIPLVINIVVVIVHFLTSLLSSKLFLSKTMIVPFCASNSQLHPAAAGREKEEGSERTVCG